MRLSQMVHDVNEDDRRASHNVEALPQVEHSPPRSQSRAHHPYREGPTASPYSSKEATLSKSAFQAAPRSPPSPPAEEASRLPSIHNLLRTADEAENSSQQAHPPTSQPQQNHFSQIRHASGTSHPPVLSLHPPQTFEPRSDSVSSSRVVLPPTPPMIADSGVDDHQSPSNSSSQSPVATQTYTLGQSLNNMEPYAQRQILHNPIIKRHSVPSHASLSPYQTSPYQMSPYQSSPGAASAPSYYSPELYPPPGLASQRPLPSYSPQSVIYSAQGSPNTSNPLQHHHYLNAQSQAAFPQTQDRYLCATCNKAFSRPSSLRIHIHSHSGEKPYKCPQPGCGKAFSVRSNMKRHERGCHAASNGGTA